MLQKKYFAGTKKGVMSHVRRDVYVATDWASRLSIASKFKIAGHITPSSCRSHHAALEYLGIAHQGDRIGAYCNRLY